MPSRELILELNSEQTNLARTGISDASDSATIVVAGDLNPPGTVVLDGAYSVPDGVKLEFTLPTTNADSTNCVDLRWAKVYWKNATGVSKSNYDGSPVVIAARAGENGTYIDTNIGTSTEMFYILTAIDSSGNESVESNELSGTGGGSTVETDIPDNADGYVFDDDYESDGIGVGYGLIGIIFEIPNSGWLNFDHYRLWYAEDEDLGGGFGAWVEIEQINSTAFMHKGLDIGHYYKYRASIVAADGDESTLYDYASNGVGDTGAGYKPNVDNTSMFDGTVLVGNLVAVNEVRGEHFFAESFLAINDPVFGNDGIQLEYRGGDPRAYIGNGSTRYFNFDGTNISWEGANTSLTTGGAFTATSATITGNITCSGTSTWTGNEIGTGYTAAKCTDADADQTSTIINGGLITTGTISFNDGSVTKAGMTATGSGDTNIRIWAGDTYANRATAPFRVSQAGVLNATNATITGSITASSGSIGGWTINASSLTGSSVGLIPGSYPFYAGSDTASSAPFRVTAAGAVACSNLAITGGTMSGGSITASQIRTASGNPSMIMVVTGGNAHKLLITNAAGAIMTIVESSKVLLADVSANSSVLIDGLARKVHFYAAGEIYAVTDLTIHTSGGTGHNLVLNGYQIALGGSTFVTGAKVTIHNELGFATAPTTGKSALNEYVYVRKSNGAQRYLRLYG